MKQKINIEKVWKEKSGYLLKGHKVMFEKNVVMLSISIRKLSSDGKEINQTVKQDKPIKKARLNARNKHTDDLYGLYIEVKCKDKGKAWSSPIT